MYDNLCNNDLIWFYNSTKESLDSIKNIHKKTHDEVDGEVFTNMRRISRSTDILHGAIREIFRGKFKLFNSRMRRFSDDKNREVLRHMYNNLKNQRMAVETNCMLELETTLLAIQAIVREAATIANTSKQIRKGLDEIPNILNGDIKKRRL